MEIDGFSLSKQLTHVADARVAYRDEDICPTETPYPLESGSARP